MQLMTDRPVRVVGSHFLHGSLKGGICFRPLVQDAGREIIGIQHRERVIRINRALFVAVYERRIKSRYDIPAVVMFIHASGVQSIGIDKEAVSFYKVVVVLVDLVSHRSFKNARNLKFRMPVAVEASKLVCG